MNVFDELIDELKSENLLETTVTDIPQKVVTEPTSHSSVEDRNTIEDKPRHHGSTLDSDDLLDEEIPEDVPDIQKPVDERDFFRKRAMDEVSSLQMVEHVLSGVEREYMKMIPTPFNDLEVKKALHRFLQVSGDLSSPEHAETEYLMMKETEAWGTALSERDKTISVANIRRFCENSRPVLSSQAFISLARFYRNSPFSEEVREKFDFVITKLFSREIGEQKRRLIFERPEMICHLTTLYENWSSISFFSIEEHHAEINGAVATFERLATEIESSNSFDALIRNDYFNRVRLVKEELNEMFFFPEIAAAAIDCNVRVGNQFVDLIGLEKRRKDARKIEDKYGYTYDHLISNAAGKTILLADLLEHDAEFDGDFENDPIRQKVSPNQSKQSANPHKKPKKFFSLDLSDVNLWLVGVTALVAVIGIGMFFWGQTAANDAVVATQAKTIEVHDPALKEYAGLMRASSQTLYVVALPSFSGLTETQKQEFMQKLYNFAKERGLNKAELMSQKGNTLGFVDADKVEFFPSK